MIGGEKVCDNVNIQFLINVVSPGHSIIDVGAWFMYWYEDYKMVVFFLFNKFIEVYFIPDSSPSPVQFNDF